MTTKQSGYLKIAGGIGSLLVAIIAVVGFVNGGVDERIDNRIIEHEAVFEAKQQETIGAIRQDVAVLDEKVEGVKEDTQDIKKILERIEQRN